MEVEFDAFTPIGSKETKTNSSDIATAIFKTYSLGVSTNRDDVVYGFDKEVLLKRVANFCEAYNAEITRYQQKNKPKDVDSFLRYDVIKWSRNLKRGLRNLEMLQFDKANVRASAYRPFTKQCLYFADVIVDEEGANRLFLPTEAAEKESLLICVSDHGFRSPFSSLLVNNIPDLHLCASSDGFQCFPFYTYNEDGTNRRENITDWALAQFREHYGDAAITKWDIFHYVYAMLHHPLYRERYAANLKRELPRIPYAPDFRAFASAGARLAELHVHYETQPEYPLEKIENPKAKLDWRVEKMKLSKDKQQIVYNDF